MTDLLRKFGIDKTAIIDFETTGLSPWKDYPTEIAIKIVGFNDSMRSYVKDYSSKIKLPDGVEVPDFITDLTGLTTEDLNANGKDIKSLRLEVANLIDDKTLVVAHNANFDLGFLMRHMGIIPAHFMCTRTISILTEPDKSASLKDVYARMFGKKEQTHRAGNDVEMTAYIFNQFITEHGYDSMMFFKNKVVNMPDRELVYVPLNAIVLDFTKKYVSSKTHNELKEDFKIAQKYAEKYSLLEAYGVDNWGGYYDAINDIEGICE